MEGDVYDKVDGVKSARDRCEPGSIRVEEHVIVVYIDFAKQELSIISRCLRSALLAVVSHKR